MLELGSSGSVRGVSSNGHPYRDPGSNIAARPRSRRGLEYGANRTDRDRFCRFRGEILMTPSLRVSGPCDRSARR